MKIKPRFVVVQKQDGYGPVMVFQSWSRFLCECLIAYFETKPENKKYTYETLPIKKFLNGEY